MERTAVGNKNRELGGAAPVAEMARFRSTARIACSEGLEEPIRSLCALYARFLRRDDATGETRFVCGQHARAGDTAIDDRTTVRVVTVRCELVAAGATTDRALAHLEAVHRLQLAALAAGLELRITELGSELARYYPSVPTVGAPDGRR